MLLYSLIRYGPANILQSGALKCWQSFLLIITMHADFSLGNEARQESKGNPP
jgi:hypothetical protein